MQYPIDGSSLYLVNNVIPWTKQGTSFDVSGSYSTVSGIPSRQLLASTNETLGYFNGQMLARASGVKADTTPSGLTAGALINFDPASLDTGQKVWNGYIICDAGLKTALPIETTYAGTLLIATPLQGWVIRRQFLYASGTPATDVSIVTTALASTTGFNLIQSQVMNSSNAYEVVFAY